MEWQGRGLKVEFKKGACGRHQQAGTGCGEGRLPSIQRRHEPRTRWGAGDRMGGLVVRSVRGWVRRKWVGVCGRVLKSPAAGALDGADGHGAPAAADLQNVVPRAQPGRVDDLGGIVDGAARAVACRTTGREQPADLRAPPLLCPGLQSSRERPLVARQSHRPPSRRSIKPKP